MPFTVSSRPVQAGGKTDTAVVLSGDTARAEVWPAFGFNCLRWQVRRADGEWGDAIYCDPTWEQNPVPTRSGHPILFPFPNRLKHGRITHEGREYQLPLNDSTGTHAIHGFTPRNPWRVVGSGGGDDSAFVSGQFQLSRDLPGSLSHWPADFVLTVTYRLSTDALTVEAVVDNPDAKSLPFGLGYHPYFCCPNAPGAAADEMIVEAATGQLYLTDSGIPIGRFYPLLPDADYRTPRPIGPTVLDTLYARDTGHPGFATLGHGTAPGRVVVSADPAFRELLLFTPPHRKAVAIEPYTCATNAANHPENGWRVLPQGGRFAATVEYRWHPASDQS
jgi:aldose 1-epimerase